MQRSLEEQVCGGQWEQPPLQQQGGRQAQARTGACRKSSSREGVRAPSLVRCSGCLQRRWRQPPPPPLQDTPPRRCS